MALSRFQMYGVDRPPMDQLSQSVTSLEAIEKCFVTVSNLV